MGEQRIRYFKLQIPISNRELYDTVTHGIPFIDLANAGIRYYASKQNEDGSRSSTYDVFYSQDLIHINFNESENMPPIEILGKRTRNINRVITKLSKLLRVEDLGRLVEVQFEESQ